jgi:peptidoglycan hydrolase-like protein with peptidoglycan-binding domain
MADEMVLETQQWLNKTYGSVSGFGTVTEDGLTGWGTVYGLIRGLQHELGITGLVNNFGSGTATAFDNLGTGYKTNKNIVYIIQGGFWCKGINPGAFDGVFSSETEQAVTEMKSDAGLSDTSSSINSTFMKALLSMSAFVLTPSGVSAVRTLQQWLNGLYSSNLGILPCDGVYQRDTNTALIYALQRAAGLSATTANGNFGPATETAVAKLSVSTSSDSPENLVKIIQYGLYLNGYGKGTASGTFTASDAALVQQFRAFMNYPNQDSGIADYTVIKGLVTSNGDTSRAAIALDCATQLTSDDVDYFSSHGYKYIGRYLTGNVGSGSASRDKSLSYEEASLIIDSGMSFFPIYEDGGYLADYFSASQGTADASIAIKTSNELGIPTGSVIYFAVDVDLQEGDITGTVLPYFREIQKAFRISGYNVGIYGTRNVCLHAQKIGVRYSFVANMSYGWSGNLGFRMPSNWAFDQYNETTIGSVDSDLDGHSGLDEGVSKLGTSNSLNNFFIQLGTVENLATEFISNTATNDSSVNLVAQFYRQFTYSGVQWAYFAGSLNSDWLEYVNTKLNISSNNDLQTMDDPVSSVLMDMQHLMAVINSLTYTGIDVITYDYNDYCGWAGDLLSVMNSVELNKQNYDNVTACAEAYIGSKTLTTNF